MALNSPMVLSVNRLLPIYPLTVTLTTFKWKTYYKLNQTHWILENKPKATPSLSLSSIEPLHQDHHVKFPSLLLIAISIKTPVIDFEDVRFVVKSTKSPFQMGLVQNVSHKRNYLSLDDWQDQHATTSLVQIPQISVHNLSSITMIKKKTIVSP